MNPATLAVDLFLGLLFSFIFMKTKPKFTLLFSVPASMFLSAASHLMDSALGAATGAAWYIVVILPIAILCCAMIGKRLIPALPVPKLIFLDCLFFFAAAFLVLIPILLALFESRLIIREFSVSIMVQCFIDPSMAYMEEMAYRVAVVSVFLGEKKNNGKIPRLSWKVLLVYFVGSLVFTWLHGYVDISINFRLFIFSFTLYWLYGVTGNWIFPIILHSTYNMLVTISQPLIQ